MRLSRAFFLKPTLEVAENLLGKYLIHETDEGQITGEINEVESYIGMDDAASHAARGKTPRNEMMFGLGGFTYIYFIYGMYFCLNVVTEQENFPAAILIRSVIPREGITLMAKNRKKDHLCESLDLAGLNSYQASVLLKNEMVKQATPIKNLSNGPGKLCLAYGLTKADNGIDLVSSDKLYIEDRGIKILNFHKTARIGIKVGLDKFWRFYY